MKYAQHYLTPLFEPKSVAIIGATESAGSIGGMLARNVLDAGYRGALYFVNPDEEQVFGHPCHPAVESLPRRLDLAVLCAPAPKVAEYLEACGRAQTRCAIVVSGKLSDPAAASLQALQEIARRHRLRLLGPDSLGLMRPAAGLNLYFGQCRAHQGAIGLVAQSGAVTTAMLDWAWPNKVGFSTVVTLGASADIDFGEALDYLVSDSGTESIFLYIEGIRNARRFMSALRAAARAKPVMLIKTGRQPAGERAALSHTGAVVGADDVFAAALRRAGVVRLATVGQIHAAAQALLSDFRPRGNRLAIITNGGGPGVMAADRASDIGVTLAEFDRPPIAQPGPMPAWPGANPVDIGDDADPARYAAALAACLDDDNVDGVLIILAPQVFADPTHAARAVIKLARRSDKPLVTCWMGEEQVREAHRLFEKAGIPCFRTPEPAIELFAQIASYYRNQKLLMQTPPPLSEPITPRLAGARKIIETALAEGRKTLGEMESKAILAAFRIPIAPTMVARSETEATAIAERIGLPVAMKVDSPQIVHKSDYGGVRLNVGDLAEIGDAYRGIVEAVGKQRPDAVIRGIAIEPMIVKPHGRELMVGIFRDKIFGPAIMLGPGGTGVEAGRERVVALPPLNGFLIADMLQSARAIAAIDALRSMPAVSMEAIESVLLRVSEMVCELPGIDSLEINPLIVDEYGAVAVDAAVVIAPVAANAGTYDHMAIHPYPSQQTMEFTSSDGQRVTIRPIKPEDAEIEQAFVRALSTQSKYFRFLNTLRELPEAQLARLTQIDYDREMAFIATVTPVTGEQEIAVARYATNPDGVSCEFAVVVADDWQGKGVARQLMQVLIDSARSRGLEVMNGDFLAENRRMLRFVGALGFTLFSHPEDASLKRGTLVLNR